MSEKGVKGVSEPTTQEAVKNPPSKFGQLMVTFHHVHGVTEWYLAKSSAAKVFWFFLLIVAVGVFLLGLLNETRTYLSGSLVTSTNLISGLDGMPLPEIFICPSNPVSEKIKQSYAFDSDWIENHLQGLFDRHSPTTGLNGFLVTASSRQKYKSISPLADCTERTENPCKEPAALAIPTNIQDYFMKLGLRQGDLFRECAFGGKVVDCSKIVTAYFDGAYGKCFKIHVNENQTADRMGLSLVLDLDLENAKQQYLQNLFDGVILKLNNSLSNEPLQLPAGSINTINLIAHKTEMLPFVSPVGFKNVNTSQCIQNVSEVELQTLQMEYSHLACIEDCQQKVALDNCHCFLPIDRGKIKPDQLTDGVDVCTKRDMDTCVAEANSNNRESLLDCRKNCRPTCVQWEYKTNVNTVKVSPSDKGSDDNANYQRDYASVCYHPIMTEYVTEPADQNIPAANHTRWAFDTQKRDCIQFEYFGWIAGEMGLPVGIKTDADGLLNFFRTKNSCLDNCAYGNRCLVERRKGRFCQDKATTRYYHDYTLNECLRFHFLGCDGNSNHFKTRDECDRACNIKDIRDKRCSVASTDINLVKREERWVFDVGISKCAIRTVELRDCQEDTINRFDNQFYCEVACGSYSTEGATNPGNKAVCKEPYLPKTLTECKTTAKYYYNIDKGKCAETTVSEAFAQSHTHIFANRPECEMKCEEYAKPVNWNGLQPDYLSPYQYDGGRRKGYENGAAKMTRGDYLVIHIAHSSLHYTETVQTNAMTILMFISNVGGHMGFWLGCSIISFFKILSFVVPAIGNCIKRSP